MNTNQESAISGGRQKPGKSPSFLGGEGEKREYCYQENSFGTWSSSLALYYICTSVTSTVPIRDNSLAYAPSFVALLNIIIPILFF